MQKSYLFIALLFFSLTPSLSIGSADCIWALSQSQKQFPLEQRVDVSGEIKKEILDVGRKFGLQLDASLSLTDIFTQAAKLMKHRNIEAKDIGVKNLNEYYASLGAKDLRGPDGWNHLVPVYKADKFGEFALEALTLLSDELSEIKMLSLQNQLAVLVHDIERWQESDYLSTSTVFMAHFPGLLIHFDDYPEMVKNYVDKTDKYQSIQGNSGVIRRQDMRQTMAHNHWPVDLLPHDMRHVHYALGHPIAVSNVFRAARSRNNLRYVLSSALYEAVDHFQFLEETMVIKYYAQERNATVELGLVYTGWVPTKELIRVAQASETFDEFQNIANSFQSWRPETSNQWPLSSRHGNDIEDDILAMITSFYTLSKDPKWRRYTNYQIEPQIGGSNTDDAEKHY